MGLLSWLRGDRGDTTAPAAEPVAPPRAPHDGWRELPPVQRVLGAPELVTDPSGFESSLSSRQDTTLSSPLGHLVSPDAPAGLVHGLTTSRTEEPEKPERAVGTGVIASWPSAVPLQRSTVAQVTVPESGAGSRSRSEPESGPVPASMVSASAAPLELPVRQLLTERPVEPVLPTTVPAATAPDEPAPPPSPLPVRNDPPPVQRSAATRPPGLGAPLAGLPPTAQRRIAARLPGPITEVESAPGPTANTVDAVNAADVAGTDAPPAPLLGDVPPLVTPPVPHVSRIRQEPHAPKPSEPRPPAYEPTPAVAPVPLQRLDVPGTQHSTPQTASGPVAPLIAQRAVPLFVTGPDAPIGRPSHQSATPATPVRWDNPGPLRSAPTTVQRSYEVTAAPSSPSLRRRRPGSPGTDAGSVAVAAGVAQRMADGSVVFGGTAAPSASSSPAPTNILPSAYGSPSFPVVQREAEFSEPPPPLPAPSYEAELPEPAPEPEPESGPGPGNGSATDSEFPGPPPSTATAAPAVTDELVRALYPPLSRLFKADLRLERERAGFLINTRH
ncbi:hypothetical protein [Streptomyces sp. NPDC093109]|uniref:hypothetical protein n=1 Tax=Streptomyces sp. NPDC093109 TaxID=3154977 RepID=UPI003450CB0E